MIAIIPARGGSKRIPGKNIKEFAGKPIIAYSIQAALEANIFDRVIVSTDSPEIADIALSFGAEIPFMRTATTSSDHATTVDALLEVTKMLQEQDSDYDLGCCIYPTAPFVKSHLLNEGLKKLIDENFDTVFPVLPFEAPIQRALRINAHDRIELISKEHIHSRSQDLPEAFHDAGQFYWYKKPSILEKKKLWTDNSGIIKLSRMQAHDIDTIDDWHLAELKFRLFNNE